MNKFLLAVGVAGLLLGGLLGYVLHGQSFGAAIGYQSAQNSQLLFNAFDSLLQDVRVARAPLGSVVSGSATFSAGTISPAVPTSTQISTPGAALGDFVIVSIDSPTSTATNLVASGYVSGAGTSTVVLSSPTGTNALASVTVRVRVLPQSSFAAPAALISSTSTSQN